MMMIAQCLQHLPATFLSFSPCAPMAQRDAWNDLPNAVKRQLLARGEAVLGHPYASISVCDWLRFSRTGDRAEFETLYFSRRRQLNDLILAEALEQKGRFFDDILNGLWALCEESAWQLPAHNTYVRDTPQLPLPDTSRPIIDLFAAETGALLAVARWLLQDRLNAVSPILCSRIDSLLQERILTPYLTCHFWWMGNGDEPMNNWTTWCTQNVLLTAFCTPCSHETRRAVVEKAAISLDCFLKDYGEDGCCSEGAQYYSHAGLCLYGCLSVLSAVAPQAFHPLWHHKKIQNIAAFIFNMHVADDYYVNFSDCSPLAGRRGAREYLFAKATGNEEMAAFAAADYRKTLAEPIAPIDGRDIERINLWYLCTECFTAAQMLATDSKAPKHNEVYYPSVGVFIARDDNWCVAVKSGGNGDSHNHNDTGSITVYKDGHPFLIDLGVETYSKKTFSPQRYEIWTMQSAWHNLATFDGVMQQDGSEFCARDVQATLGDKASSICMELAGAWPASAHLTSYRRTVTLYKGEHIIVEDHCCGTYQKAVLSLMVQEQPFFSSGSIQLGKLGSIQHTGEAATVESLSIQDARLRIAWPDTLYRITIPFSHTITLDIR